MSFSLRRLEAARCQRALVAERDESSWPVDGKLDLLDGVRHNSAFAVNHFDPYIGQAVLTRVAAGPLRREPERDRCAHGVESALPDFLAIAVRDGLQRTRCIGHTEL